MPGVSGLALVESLGIPLCLTLPCLPAPGWQVQYHPHDHQRGLRGGTHGSGEYLSPPPEPRSTTGGGGTAQGRELSQCSRSQSWGDQRGMGLKRTSWDFTLLWQPPVSAPAWDSLSRAREASACGLAAGGSPGSFAALSPLPLK